MELVLAGEMGVATLGCGNTMPGTDFLTAKGR
jgi:hypothetical protein